MKLTLLEMVQDILNDIDGDLVNSIGDTEESLQVAQIVKTSFAEMATLRDLPSLRKFRGLENLSDATKPNYMKVPDNTSRVDFIAYNTRKEDEENDNFQEVHYLYPDEFVQKCNGRDPTDDRVDVITDLNGSRLNIYNDRSPRYWTSFDDTHLVFDAWPSDYTSTLVEENSQAILYMLPEWTMDDDFIPPVPAELFPLYLAEAKSAASYKLRQVADQKAEQQSKRQQRMASQRGWRSQGGIRYPNYGRSRKGTRIASKLPKYH
jgi:hypothetical protein